MSNEDKDAVKEENHVESLDSENEGSDTNDEIEEEKSLVISQELQSYIETELGMVKFLDYLIEEPYDLSFRNIDTYTKRFFEQFMKAERDSDDELLTAFKDLRVEDAVKNIKQKSEEIAIENGYKKNIQKRMNRANYIIMGIVFGILIIVMWAFPNIANIILVPMMVIVCFVPTLIKKLMEDKWKAFKSEHLEDLLSAVQGDIDDLRAFNQLALNDCREYMLNHAFPLQLLKFDLYSNDYQGLNLLQEKVTNKQKLYYFEYEYPDGIEPFPVPKQVVPPGKAVRRDPEPTIDEDDENDIFILLPNTDFSHDDLATISEQKIAAEDEQTKIISLLDNAEKFDVIDEPENIIKDFYDNKQLTCICETPLKLKEIRNVTSSDYSNFEFYLGISTKCKSCGKNPFVIIKKRNFDIPDELVNLF